MDEQPTRLDEFLDRYTPEVAGRARQALAQLRPMLPGAVELVYDNYNALAIGFSSSERACDILFSITLYPRWVSLFFTQGAALPDPDRLLKGRGNKMRHILLSDERLVDSPKVAALIQSALEHAGQPFRPGADRKVIVKSVSARQRARRPAERGA